MTEAILIIAALGGLELTLWLLGRQQQAQQLNILESIHTQLLLRNASRALTTPLPSTQQAPATVAHSGIMSA